MAGGNDEQMRQSMGGAISTALATQDEMVTKWVAIVESIDNDGLRALWLLTDEGAKPWDTLGMLTFGIQQEQVASIVDDDD